MNRTELQNSLKITNLRIVFSKFHRFGNLLSKSSIYTHYYAVSEIKLYGSCLCNGHASKCTTFKNIQYDFEHLNRISPPLCLCDHYTTGENCERCMDLYNDRYLFMFIYLRNIF